MIRALAISIVFAIALAIFSPTARAEPQACPGKIAWQEGATPEEGAALHPAGAAEVKENADRSAPDPQECQLALLGEARGVLPGGLSGHVSVVSARQFPSANKTTDSPAGEGTISYGVDVGLAGGQPFLAFRGATAQVESEDATELDLEAGLTGKLAAINWSIGGRHLTHLADSKASISYRYWEIPLGIAVALSEDISLLGQYAYSPNFIANSGQAHYALVGARWEQSLHSATFSIEGTTGHQWIADNATYGSADYQDWRLIASLTVIFD
jgi:hypothetical protein